MSRSWSSIVRGSDAPLSPVAVPISFSAPISVVPQVVFHAFCADCGKDADVCRSCDSRAVYEDGLCGFCFSYQMDSECMCEGYVRASESADKIPFKCGPCRAERPWSWTDDKEIVGYFYDKSCWSEPLSPRNVIRVPRYRTIGAKPTDLVQRADEALAAYNEELAFSNNMAEALRIYTSFYKNIKTKPVQDGPVTLQQIMAGQSVTGAQFFQALRNA